MITVSSVLPSVRAPTTSSSAASALAGTAAAPGTYDGRRGGTGGERGGEVPDPLTGRREFLNYCLSLMRAHNGEHSDTLPVIDVSSLKHIAYVFDALIYYMRSGNEANPFGDNASAEDYMTDMFNEPVRSICCFIVNRISNEFLFQRMKTKTGIWKKRELLAQPWIRNRLAAKRKRLAETDVNIRFSVDQNRPCVSVVLNQILLHCR